MQSTKYFMLMSLYHKKVSYACYAHAYVRTERYAYEHVDLVELVHLGGKIYFFGIAVHEYFTIFYVA